MYRAPLLFSPGMLTTVCVLGLCINSAIADTPQEILTSLLNENCVYCHGNDEANADINFEAIQSDQDWLKSADLIQRVLDAIDTGAMPPESEPALDATLRTSGVTALQALRRTASAQAPNLQTPLQRLNRFQYNNTVRDLFQLDRDLFPLPEKLMTRYDAYLQTRRHSPQPARVPETVHVASHSLQPLHGLSGVTPFPKDLRAEHGFDNQANQLSLSPLLLDAFLRLSVSIVESPDFNADSVGIWREFFAAPDPDLAWQLVVKERLHSFLTKAFRRPVDDETLDRYTAYAMSHMHSDESFTAGMKKVAAAALSSPMFFCRSSSENEEHRDYELAERLSYFLWGSCPDDELLRLAREGRLGEPDVRDHTIERMLADPKIERFLDAFPAQWLQLENVLAATPAPSLSSYFRLDPEFPASLPMVLEPLLLFDTVFVEDRPLAELITPSFSYRNRFLEAWYGSDLQPPVIDQKQLAEENRARDEQRDALRTSLEENKRKLSELIEPIRTQMLQARHSSKDTPAVDLRPYAVWEFEETLNDSQGGLHLEAHGDITFQQGMVALDQSYLLSKPLPIELRAKTLEVWCVLENLDQPGGGLMGIQGPKGRFDTIVIGERKRRHWIAGSDSFHRTEDFEGSVEESVTDELLHLVMIFGDDGTTTFYRNGELYGKPFSKGQATFPRDESSVIFGLRHLPPGGNKFLKVKIDQARLYDRALTADEVSQATMNSGAYISESELITALTPDQKAQHDQLREAIDRHRVDLKEVPANVTFEQATESARKRFEAELRRELRSREFRRVELNDARYGGIITNAATLTMTSGPLRTHPVARGVWVIEVLFNNPPAPPPNDVPPLTEDAAGDNQTIRERFAAHRDHAACAGCHTKLDPLGFALENYDVTGRWRDVYPNGRQVDASGSLLRRYEFRNPADFKLAIVQEKQRFVTAFTKHLLRYALARELGPADLVAIDDIVSRTEADDYRLQAIIRAVIHSDQFSTR
jgi:mono/diheme cytochrome c family protein